MFGTATKTTALRRFSTTAAVRSGPSVTLNSGYSMPLVGFGIWKVPATGAADTVYKALKTGYRLIDGAYDYCNSAEAGKGVRDAIADGIVKREEVFITSKLWNNYHRPEHVVEQAGMENEAWGLGYLDAFLVHFPISLKYIPPSTIKFPCWWKDSARTQLNEVDPVPMYETWGAMESLAMPKDSTPTKEKFVRSIGVSNFHTQLLYDMLAYAKIPPAMLQIEHHPYLTSKNLVAMAQEHGLAVTAYSTFGPASFVELDHPLAKKAAPLLEHKLITEIATRHGKTPAQVLLRWCTQRGVAVIPKSNHPERAAQNLECSGFDLSDAEIDEISGLDCGMRFNDPSGLEKPLRIWV